MTQIKAEIIAVGTELLLGQIANTNAQWLSQRLALNGINTFYHTVVGDNLHRVVSTFKEAEKRSNIIIVTGGLGPTEDDMTREAFQKISHLEMEMHEPALKKIEAYFEKQNEEMPPNNKRQARVFSSAEIIENELGMAPGMIVSKEKATWIFLPGVPREMKQMVNDTVIPYLLKLNGEQTIIMSKTLKFIGIGESLLEHRLSELIQTQSNPTIAPLAQNDHVVIRLTVKETSRDKAQKRLLDVKEQILLRVGDYYFGDDDETIEETISTRLKNQKKRVAAAESLTGGLFVERLISIQGALEACVGGIVCYDESIKRNILQVSEQTLQEKGVVSKECALELAENVCHILQADIGISFTGVAGPTSLNGSPIGTVYISIYSKSGKQQVDKFVFQGDRNQIRNKAMVKGLELLFRFLKE